MIGAVEGVLHVSEHGIDPGESIQGDTVRAAAGNDADVLAVGLLNGSETAQAVRDCHAPALRRQQQFGHDGCAALFRIARHDVLLSPSTVLKKANRDQTSCILTLRESG